MLNVTAALRRLGLLCTEQSRRNVSFRFIGESLSVRNLSTLPSSAGTTSNHGMIEQYDVPTQLTDVVLEPVKRNGGFVGQRMLDDFTISASTLRNLDAAGITHLFPVQAESFDIMMNGKDIVGRSKTGSGKTLAFGLPIIERLTLMKSRSRCPQALILLPTRELSLQVANEITRIAPHLRIGSVVGGVPYVTQEKVLRHGIDILVGTPGRIMDLVDKGSLTLSEVKIAVLDEADMMLKFGFQDAVETIFGWMPEKKQCVMWSATFPKWVNTMARKFLNDPVSIDLVGNDDNHVPTTVVHKAIHASLRTRVQLLEGVIRQYSNGGQTLIFTETKQEADEIAGILPGSVRALHGDLSQGMRTSTMEGFRTGSVKTLVCTDIAARGLDIANVELVIQYRLPNDKESFVHRAGRTGRAGRCGTNVVFFDRAEVSYVKEFENRYKFNFRHVSPPQLEDVLEGTMSETSQRLSNVPADCKIALDKYAQALYDQHGVGALSSALAIITGLDNRCLHSVSMLTGRQNMQTIEMQVPASARQVSRMIGDFLGSSPSNSIHAMDGKYFFDIPHHAVQDFQAFIKGKGLKDAVVSQTIELPRLLINREQRPAPGSTARLNRRSSGNNSRFSRHRTEYSSSFKRRENQPGMKASGRARYDRQVNAGRSRFRDSW